MREQPWPIPAHLIKKEKVDLENEALSALGASVAVGKTLLSAPLCLGVMTMLETIDNPVIRMMFTGEFDIEPQSHDLHMVFYLNHHRQDALEDARQYYRGNEKPLDKKVQEFAKKHKISDQHISYLEQMLSRSVLGFKMIPGSGGSQMIYGAESIATMSYICSTKLGVSHNDIVWNTPLTLIGHIVALSQVENGVKNVERPHDLEHLNWFKTTCIECDENEDIYPWQKDDPFKIGIFKWQSEKVLTKWVEAANKYISRHGDQPKRNKDEIKRVRAIYKELRTRYLKQLKKESIANNG